LIFIPLLFFVLSNKSSSAQEFDIIDFMPSILAGVLNTDNDGDGYSENQGDCNDSNPDIYPTNNELCDGADNDCDGQTDEGFSLGNACGFGQCAGGIEICSPDGFSTICNTLSLSIEEECNGLDDDCDGQTDEDFLDLGNACGVGACVGGTIICSGDSTFTVCNTDSLATVETCNSLDDDCDGQTDEGCDNSFVSTKQIGMKALK